LNQRDSKGSTALHWASYLGCENAATFLVSWGVDVNLPDKEGSLTPLHLAVLSGNTRIVRKLLIKGARKDVRDRKEKLPIDLAIENDYTGIITMLKDNSCWEKCCNIRTLPKQGGRTRLYLLGFFALISLGIASSILFLFPGTT
jgi:palmitoyltransferase